ncbi:phosphohistidine phosphatase SixA [Vibrio sp.]|nr:phosphohistidine phosphatase SixA [Vibrio sp.]
MKVIVFRHGEAHPFASSDAQRELTDKGRQHSFLVAQKAFDKGLVKIDKVLVSPYVRAQQTWDAIADIFSSTQVETCDDITPYGDAEMIVQYVSAMAEAEQLETVLLVSHLPVVSYMTAEFVKGISPPIFPTSGMVCLEFDIQRQSGDILWKLYP